MTIYGLAISQRKPDLFFYTGVIEEHTRPVNHFSEVPDVRLPQQRHNTLRIDHRAGGIESSRRNTARRAEKKFEGHLLAIFDHILHTLNSQHVTDLMRIRHCGYSTINDGHPSKFDRHKHGAFNVNVCVNDTRDYDLVLGVQLFVDGNDHAVAYFDFSEIDHATLNVDNLTRYLHRRGMYLVMIQKIESVKPGRNWFLNSDVDQLAEPAADTFARRNSNCSSESTRRSDAALPRS